MVAWLLQDALLYYPDRRGPAAAERLGLRAWPSVQDPRGYLAAQQPEAPWATAIVWHGNAGSAIDRVYFTVALQRRGLRVVLAEYPGYGGRPGPRREKNLVEDARGMTRLAREEWGQPVIVVGESMGCAVATAVASDPGLDVRAVLLVTPWADLPALAQSVYWWLPARWLTRDRFDNAANLSGFAGPVVIAMAEGDEVIPNAHTERLYEGIRAPKRQLVFPSGGHNGWPVEPDAVWWTEAMEFLRRESGLM